MAKSKMRSGKQFESEISYSLRVFQRSHGLSFFWHKLADTYTFIRIKNFIAPKQPFDYFCLYKGLFYGLEAKSTRGKNFRYDWLKPHQRRGLKEVVRAGGIGILLMSFRKIRPVTCYAMGILEYEAMEKEFREDRKSVPMYAFEENGLKLQRLRSKTWNMAVLFK